MLFNNPMNRARQIWLASLGLHADATKTQRRVAIEQAVASMRERSPRRSPNSVAAMQERIDEARARLGV